MLRTSIRAKQRYRRKQKTNQYLSFKNLVHVTDGYEGFKQGIERALTEDSPKGIVARLDAMAGESWEQKVARVSELVTKHIPGVYNC